MKDEDKYLEDEMEKFGERWPYLASFDGYDKDWVDELTEECAKHFYELGKTKQKEHDAELIEIAYNDGITIGMTKQKEQMLKDAVEGEVLLTPYPTICLDDCKDYDFKDGQKVRVIVIPNTDEK